MTRVAEFSLLQLVQAGKPLGRYESPYANVAGLPTGGLMKSSWRYVSDGSWSSLMGHGVP